MALRRTYWLGAEQLRRLRALRPLLYRPPVAAHVRDRGRQHTGLALAEAVARLKQAHAQDARRARAIVLSLRLHLPREQYVCSLTPW
jgi:hypothetical protein